MNDMPDNSKAHAPIELWEVELSKSKISDKTLYIFHRKIKRALYIVNGKQCVRYNNQWFAINPASELENLIQEFLKDTLVITTPHLESEKMQRLPYIFINGPSLGFYKI